jgi:diguanylate cyclase (GGDEF)-like protein/PAS domain S-box-containing protein
MVGCGLMCPSASADARRMEIESFGLLEATPERLVVVDARGRIRWANGRAHELLGYLRGELEGRSLDQVFQGGLDRVTSDGRDVVCRRSDGAQVRMTVRAGHLDGPEPGFVITIHDVRTIGPHAEPAGEATFRAVVEQISAITYTWSWREGEYFVVYASPQIESILGYTPEEWAADPTAWYEWVHPEDRKAVIEENKRCELTAESFAMQYRMTRKDGTVIWVEDSWVVVDNEHEGRRVFQGVVFDITERKIAEEEIAFLAHNDKLTRLPNRAFFESTLEMAISRARRHRLGITVLFLDLDNFKLVNDSLGHHAGDELLIQLADRLRSATRDADLVARQGGDEFLVLLSDIDGEGPSLDERETSTIVADAVARRVEEALQVPFELGGTSIRVSASIGISRFPKDGVDSETLLRSADAAMYQAKRFARGGHSFSAARGEQPLEKLALSTMLHHAVEEQRWLLHYQPILHLSTGRMIGVEALIRWREPNGTMIPPADFIPLAEELGLIETIGDWVIEEAARQQRAWADQGLDLEMSVNLSPRQLWADGVTSRLLGRLESAHVDPRRFVVEITESAAMTDVGRTQQVLGELHASGLSLAIDDFGTGYSSLSRLRDMPVDILKIDRSFIREVDKDRSLAGMVRAMIEMARSQGMISVAEGIETEGELSFLRSAGCVLAQGYYFAKPAPAESIPAFATSELLTSSVEGIRTPVETV